MNRDQQDEGEAPADADADADEPASAPGLSVELTLPPSAARAGAALSLDWLEAKTREALAILGCERGELSLVLLDDAAMQAAHLKHLGLDSTTDVLTFDLGAEASPQGPLEAEILVCLDEAARQAHIRGHDTQRELLLYIIHGVLHCRGYDDHTEDDYQRMHAREDEILQQLNLPPTFTPSESTPADRLARDDSMEDTSHQ